VRVNVGTKVIVQPMTAAPTIRTASGVGWLAPPVDEFSRHKNGVGSAQCFCFLT
jgi:hypothetical protein